MTQTGYNKQTQAGDFPPPNANDRVGFSTRNPRQSNGEDAQKDFEELCQSIESAVKGVAQSVGSGLGQAGSAFGEVLSQAIEDLQQAHITKGSNPSHLNKHLAKRAQSGDIVKWDNRFKSPAANTAAGITLASIGGIGTITFGFSAIAGSALLTFSSEAIAGIASCGIFAALSIWALAAGIHRLRLSRVYKSFRRTMGNREVCSFKELSAQSGIPVNKIQRNAQRMLKAGFFPQGHIDDEGTCLIATNEAYKQYRQAKLAYIQRQKEAREIEQARVAGRLHEDQGALTAQEKAFIDEVSSYIQRFRSMDAAIDDPQVSEKIQSIQDVLVRILQRAKDAPSVISMLDRLTSYYLPTTLKLLCAYDELEKETIRGDNIERSRTEIEHTLDVLANAFEKLLDDTYKDMALDVNSDISVLHSVLAQDGLTDSPFNTTDQKGQ